MEIKDSHFEILEFLCPTWLMLKRGAFNGKSLTAMFKKGWIDLRRRPDYVMVRLTPDGVQIRDSVHRRLARMHNIKAGWTQLYSWAEFEKRFPENGGDSTAS